jgi:threonine-phosphate decarboxylase
MNGMAEPAMRTHGGQAPALARELGCPVETILDFSASLNPLGPPAEALAAAQAALLEVCHYPESDAASLARALATHHGLPEACVLAGAGATEFIFLLPRLLRPRRVLLVEPAFSEYRPALSQAGARVDTLQLAAADDFRLDPAALGNALHPDTDLVWLANPLNPGGTGYPRDLLLQVAADLPPAVRLVIDEAFIDFAPHLSLADQVVSRSNLIILRSLTKFYALAGLRIGWVAAAPALAALLGAGREPWRLSTPAIAAGLACLQADALRTATLQAIPVLRHELAAGLEKLGCTVSPAVANYLLCRLPVTAPTAGDIAALLRPQRILVRTCTDFAGLGDRHLRLAVRRAADNRRLLAELARLFA